MKQQTAPNARDQKQAQGDITDTGKSAAQEMLRAASVTPLVAPTPQQFVTQRPKGGLFSGLSCCNEASVSVKEQPIIASFNQV